MQEEVPDLYAVLGVKRREKQSIIKKKFQRRVVALQGEGKPTEDLETAYAMLSNPASREEYDALLLQNVKSVERKAPRHKREVKKRDEAAFGHIGGDILRFLFWNWWHW